MHVSGSFKDYFNCAFLMLCNSVSVILKEAISSNVCVVTNDYGVTVHDSLLVCRAYDKFSLQFQ